MRKEVQSALKKDYEKVKYQINSTDGSYQILIKEPKRALEENNGSDKSI